MKSLLPDGLYGVDWRDISASFEVHNGEVTRIAPVLKRRFPFFESIAVPVVVDYHPTTKD